MTLYSAYGLALEYEGRLPLLELSPANPVDVRIALAPREMPGAPGGTDRRSFSRHAGGWTLRYDNHAGGWISFDYDPTRRLVTIGGSEAPEQAVKPLVGIVCALLLSEHGRVLLHSAVLRVGAGAVALLGPSGSGKSTFAAALVAHGAELLAEDLLALAVNEDGATVLRGPTTLSLLDDAYELFRAVLPQQESGSERNLVDGKHQLLLTPQSERLLVPLAAFYSLNSGPESLMGGTAATAELLRNLYGLEILGPVARRHLAFCTRLARKIPMVSIARSLTLAGVSDQAASIVRSLLDPAAASLIRAQ